MSNKTIEKAPKPIDQVSVFTKRKRTFTVSFIGVAAIFFIAVMVTEYNVWEGLSSIPKAIVWVSSNFIPNRESFKLFPAIMEKLIEVSLLSVAVTVCAGTLAFFFSLLGTKTLKMNPIIGRVVRIVAAFFRNVPDVVWAMLLLFSFGQNILTGFFALFFATFGMLTRTFIETIDEVSTSCVEALHATGATALETIFQGVIPSALPELVSWLLFMIETNIRSSTLIGVLTATGIGYLFDLYYKRMNYQGAGLVVISIVVVVIAIETISSKIRKVIM